MTRRSLPRRPWGAPLPAVLAALLLLAVAQPGHARAPSRQREPAITPGAGLGTIVFQGDLLSVTLKDADLEAALKEIARKCNLEIQIDAPLDEKVTVQFAGLPLEKGLRKLLKSQSYTFFYGDRNGPDGLEAVRIMGEGKRQGPGAGSPPPRFYQSRPVSRVRTEPPVQKTAEDLPESPDSEASVSAEALKALLSRYSEEGEAALDEVLEDVEGDPEQIRPRLMKALEDAKKGGSAELRALRALFEAARRGREQ